METATPKFENRRANRFEVDCSLRFSHLPSSKSLRARCLNISESGALLLVPMHIPVIEGQNVELFFSQNAFNLVLEAGFTPPGSNFQATVARIDRQALLEEAGIRIGLEFL